MDSCESIPTRSIYNTTPVPKARRSLRKKGQQDCKSQDQGVFCEIFS